MKKRGNSRIYKDFIKFALRFLTFLYLCIILTKLKTSVKPSHSLKTKGEKNMKSSKVLFITQAGVIAAIYVVLTLLAASLNLANGAIQVRFSEALTILPFLTPAAIPGVTLGCLISNIITGCHILDIVFGTLATLIGALGSYYIGRLFKKSGNSLLRLAAPLPPIISNTLIIPLILTFAYKFPDGIPFLMLTVGIGEVLSCMVLGLILLSPLLALKDRLFNAKKA